MRMWVLLDPPLLRTFARGLRRTIRRTITREELWNGNREQIRHVLTRYWIPWWILGNHRRHRHDVPERVAALPHLALVQLRSDDEVERYLQSIQATESMSGSSNGSERQNTPPLAET